MHKHWCLRAAQNCARTFAYQMLLYLSTRKFKAVVYLQNTYFRGVFLFHFIIFNVIYIIQSVNDDQCSITGQRHYTDYSVYQVILDNYYGKKHMHSFAIF